MKPCKVPERLESQWQDWPTLDDLHKANEGIKLHVLRALLAAVPCYRCVDNTVRYDGPLAAAALERRFDVDDDAVDESSIEADILTLGGPGAGLVSVMIVLKELGRMIGDARREKNETIKTMGEPLRVGIELMKQANLHMADRLKHYDGLWDGMLGSAERLASHEADREIQRERAQQQTKMRDGIFTVFKSNLPKIVQGYSLSRKASAAVELVSSLEGPIVDSMLEHDIFTARQKELITMLRTKPPAGEEPQAEPEPAESNNHGVS